MNEQDLRNLTAPMPGYTVRQLAWALNRGNALLGLDDTESSMRLLLMGIALAMYAPEYAQGLWRQSCQGESAGEMRAAIAELVRKLPIEAVS